MEIIGKSTGRWFEVERDVDGVVIAGFAGYRTQRFGYLVEDRTAVEAWVRGETDHIR